MSSYEDLPSAAVGASDCNGDGKDDYVFVNGSDAGSDDHGEPDCNGEVNDLQSNVDKVGEGDAQVNEGDQIETCNGNGALQQDGDVDLNEKVEEEGDSEVNGHGQSELHDQDSGELNGELEINGGKKMIENGMNREEGGENKLQGGVLVLENGEINSHTEALPGDGGLAVENGSSNDVEDVGAEVMNLEVVDANGIKPLGNEFKEDESCTQNDDNNVVEVDVGNEIMNLEVVEANATKPLTNGFKDEESCKQIGNSCSTSIAGTATEVMSDDEKTGFPMVAESDSCAETAIMEPIEIAVTESKSLVPDGDSEVQQQLSETQMRRHEDQDNKLETPETDGGGLEVVADNGLPHLEEVLIRETEPLVSNPEGSKPLETDFVNQLPHCGVAEKQPLDDEHEGPHPPESSDSHPLNDETKNLLVEDAVSVDQHLDCQLPEVDPAAGKSEELDSMKTGTEVEEPGGFDPLDEARDQEMSSVNPEAAISDLHRSDESEINLQNAKNLTAEPEEVQESHAVPLQSEGLESNDVGAESLVCDITDHSDVCETELSTEVAQSHVTSAKVMLSDAKDEPAVDYEIQELDANGASELIAEKVRSQDSPVEGDAVKDQVAEGTEPVDVMDKEIFSDDHGLESTMSVTEEISLSEIQTASSAAIDDRVGASEKDVLDDQANNSLTAQASDETTGAERCLKAEHSDLSLPVDDETEIPDPNDSFPREEQGVDVASCVIHTSSSCSADDTSSQPKLASTEGTRLDGSSNDTVKSKISFGSFECEAPFSHVDPTVLPEVLNRSVELTSSELKDKTIDGVASLNTEASGDHFTGFDHERTCPEDKVLASPVHECGADVSNGQNVRTEVVRRPFYYLIRVPRYDDENIREKIRLGEIDVAAKTQFRDSVRAEHLKAQATNQELKSNLKAAKTEERAARDLVIAKKREIESAQSLINVAKNAMTVEDVKSRILNLEHKIQHETLHLNEEKQLIREIRQMKNLKDQLHANARDQEKLQQALDQRVQVEEHLKILKKEMDALRDNLSKAEQSVKVAKKKYDDEISLQNKLYEQFQTAANVRQKAYEDLQNIKKQFSAKSKPFYNYKDDVRAANEFAVRGDKDSLERHCVEQVEKIMDLWNKNDEFRKEYIRCNTRSTLRRFRTLDGRSLGPDEETPSLGNVSDDRVTSSAKVSSVEKNAVRDIPQEPKNAVRDIPLESKTVEDTSSKKVPEQNNKTVPAKKMPETTSKKSSAEASASTVIEEEEKEEVKLTKEEVELAKKAEQLRREEEAARLREQRRLEEKAKAKEALERKKKLAEKAQARAEFRARKEAEQKQKEREKRAKKKEKKGLNSEIVECEPTEQVESPSETIREPEIAEQFVTVTKKSPKPSPYVKQIKTTQPIPPGVRNKGKRKLPNWLLCVILIMAGFVLYLGQNFDFSRFWNLHF